MQLGKTKLNTPEDLETLKLRAQLLASTTSKKILLTQDSLVCFSLGNEDVYAIPYNEIISVIPSQKIIKIPHSPQEISGIIYYDGSVITILNFQRLLNISILSDIESQYIVLIGNDKQKIGLSIAALLDQVTYDSNEKLSELSSMNSSLSYIKGIYSGKIAVVDTNAVLNSQTIQIKQRDIEEGNNHE